MMQFKRHWWMLGGVAASILFAACGGGDSGPATVTPPPYTMTPSVVQSSFVEGYPSSIYVSAKQTVAFIGLIYIKVVPDQAVLAEPIDVLTSPDGNFAFSVQPLANLKAGHYTGNFSVSICQDAVCNRPLAGAPFKVPYDIEVISPEGGVTAYNLTKLAPLPGAPDWGTFQGNAAHTGFVPVTLNAAAFNPRWKWNTPAYLGVQWTPSVLTTGAGMFYMASGVGYELLAHKEDDGSQVWSHSFSDLPIPNTNPPAFSGGKVFISAGSQESTAMFAFDAMTGAQVFKSPMSSQWENYFAPTIANGLVYSNGGSFGGLFAFDAAAGTARFFANAEQYDGWTPAVNEKHAYAYTGGKLGIYDSQTGAPLGSINDPTYFWNGYTTAGAPVLGGENVVYAGNLQDKHNNSIVSFDSLNKSVRWFIRGAYSGNPAYADGALFASNNMPFALEVYKEADGTKLWTWTPPAGNAKFVSDVLVTNNLVFVSTDTTTFAIDRTSHAPVWNYAASGSLALSANGILYIKGTSSIVAINLL